MRFRAEIFRNHCLAALVSITCTLLLLVGSAVAEEATEIAAPESLAKLGVPSYQLQVEGASAVVDLLSPEKRRAGTVRFSWSVDDGNVLELERDGKHILLFFHPLGGKVELIDLRTDQSATAELTDGKWQLSEETESFFKLYAAEIELMSLVHDDAYFNQIQGPRMQTETECAVAPGAAQKDPLAPLPFTVDESGDRAEKVCTPICNGPTVRGQNLVALSKSQCCAAARADANLLCWNQYCTGCCAFFDCDAYCLLGDYLCAPCGITGRACGGLDCTPDPPCGQTVNTVSVLDFGVGGVSEKSSSPIRLSRLEESPVMHHGEEVSYLMAEWAVISVGQEKGPAIKASSPAFPASAADSVLRSIDKSDSGGPMNAIVVATPPHEANSRQIPLPSLNFKATGMPASASGEVAVRVDFDEDGQLQQFDILHDTLGGVPAALARHLEEAVSLAFQTEEKHRVVAFVVLGIDDTLKVRSELVYLPKCCCGTTFCV